jgi:serine protease Do
MSAIAIISLGWVLKSIVFTTNPGVQSDRSKSNEPIHPTDLQNIAKIERIAQEVTVRIATESAYGSGVVVAHQGRTYTVLTCQHVAAESKQGIYQVLTADGKTYPARLQPWQNVQKLDLALIEFESPTNYPTVKLGDLKQLPIGSSVYAAGFPNYYLMSKDNMEETYKLGRKIFKFTPGTVDLILDKPSLPDGYSLGYTNEVELGMSGGPVLNENGELIGINGRSKYPIQGIDAFTFTDGTKPSIEKFQQMEPLSWAIPIYTSFWSTSTR